MNTHIREKDVHSDGKGFNTIAYYIFDGLCFLSVGNSEEESTEKLQEKILEFKDSMTKDINETFKEFNEKKARESLTLELKGNAKELEHLDMMLLDIQEKKRDIKEEKKLVLEEKNEIIHRINNLSSS